MIVQPNEVVALPEHSHGIARSPYTGGATHKGWRYSGLRDGVCTRRTRGACRKFSLIGLVIVGCVALAVASPALAGEGQRTRGAARAGAPKGSEYKVDATVETPRIIAVRIHHDRCPYCQRLAPEFAALSRASDGDGVLFVTLDLSNAATQRQAALMAAALGIEYLWTGDFSRIGTVTFVDGKSKRTLSTYRAAEEQELQAALREAVKASRTDGS